MAKIEAHQEPRFIQEQYDRLMRCSAAKDMSEWNDWRDQNPNEEIWLQGKKAFFPEAYLKKAQLWRAHLQGAHFEKAHLEGANLFEAHLENAHLETAYLKETILSSCHLEGANLVIAQLNGAILNKAHLEGAVFRFAYVDAETHIVYCSYDKETDFTGVGMDMANIDPGLKAALKDNIRRIHWLQWLGIERKKKKWMVPWLWPWPVMLFWWVTDYGSSTKRIIGTFFALATAFCLIYWLLAMVPGSQSVIDELRQVPGSDSSKPAITFGCMHTLVRSFYFSVVTMTTLGFGDMHAAKTGGWPSCVGYVLLTLQVLLGYVFLGALVTRLGILFTGEAPAAEPTSSKTKEIKQE